MRGARIIFTDDSPIELYPQSNRRNSSESDQKSVKPVQRPNIWLLFYIVDTCPLWDIRWPKEGLKLPQASIYMQNLSLSLQTKIALVTANIIEIGFYQSLDSGHNIYTKESSSQRESQHSESQPVFSFDLERLA